MQHPHLEQQFQCVTIDSFASKWSELAYNVAAISGFYFIPVCVIVACFKSILGNIASFQRQPRVPSASRVNSSTDSRSPVVAQRLPASSAAADDDEGEEDSCHHDSLLRCGRTCLRSFACCLNQAASWRLIRWRSSGSQRLSSCESSPSPSSPQAAFSLDSGNRSRLMHRAKRESLRFALTIVLMFVLCKQLSSLPPLTERERER